MNYKESLQILGLKKEFTLTDLKKAYYKKALLYHPDKSNTKDDTMFKKINSAYQFLKTTPSTLPFSFNDYNSTLQTSVHSIFTKSFFMEYIRYVMNIDADTLDTIDIILNNTKKLSSYMIDTIHLKHLQKVEKFLKKYKLECKSLYKIIEDILHKHKQYSSSNSSSNSNKMVYNISVDLNDLFSSNIFVLKHHNDLYYIPLWYHELDYDDFIVKMNTNLPDHIHVDINNHIYCHIHLNNSHNDFIKNNINTLFQNVNEHSHYTIKYKYELFDNFFINIPIENIKWREIIDTNNNSLYTPYIITMTNQGILKLNTHINEESYLNFNMYTCTDTNKNINSHKSNLYVYFHN